MSAEPTRNNRKELIGFVRSKTGDKSVKVVYEYKIPRPLYKKEIRRKTTVRSLTRVMSPKLVTRFAS